ncbi:uncharacterized protein LOC127277441 [Leptopilina boulardi]|uniref:uncharacterized protein LOC127277441 n=1 Tax=Leptopilina boulardi TaxID=63433 RepID=UPI0021F53612|nr:uncharacterized protein LOC127277441 [Leptopilina boulardi]
MNSNTSSILMQQSLDFQFLSVCHYITIFGIYFYNNDLITLDERSQSVPVLNTLFEYLNKSKNESEAKLQLLKKVLKGSDLYGGGENETLDMKYVDETYQYIISEALFSHYGNINGYLAKIINVADDINYSVLKEKVFQHLSENYTSREYCSNNIPLGNYGSKNIPFGNSSSKLNGLTIQKVFNDYIWQIFPQPEQDMSIMEVNYMYAMVGLKIIRSVSSTTPNLTFQEYILISRELDLQDFNNETYEMVLKLFSTPALFFYAYNQKAKFQKIDFPLTDEFWIEAYENLFSHISFTMKQIVTKKIENSLHYKLENEMNTLKSRTFIAANILRLYCDYENIVQVPETDVYVYKTLYTWMTKLILSKRCRFDELPYLETIYENQFKDVERLYNAIEKNAIEKVLLDGNLIEKLNFNATVQFARVPDYPMYISIIPPVPRSVNKDIYLLFVIKQNKNQEFYAIRQEKNSLKLLINRGNEQEFAKAVANDPTLNMEIEILANFLKRKNENYKMFIQRIADIKTKQFIAELMNHYREPTIGEKILDFIKSLIPFYSCIESISENNKINAAFSCTMDILSLIPFFGFATEFTTKLTSVLTIEIGERYLLTNSLVGILEKLTITKILKQISQTAVRTIAGEILSRRFLKDLVVSMLRTLDPGFELIYQGTRISWHGLRHLFNKIITKFQNIPSANRIILFLKSILKNRNLVSDKIGLVLAKRNGYEIVRYYYQGGSHFFGPTCLISLGKTAELRTIIGNSFPIPVVAENSPNGIIYKQFIPKTGDTIPTKLKMDKNDVLHRIGFLLDVLVLQGEKLNPLHNYHVYHNTINWNKKPEESAKNQNQESRENFSNSQESIQALIPNAEFQVTLRGNLGSNYPQANIELTGTLRGNIVPQVPIFDQPGTSKEIEPSSSKYINSLYTTSLKDLLNAKSEMPGIIKFEQKESKIIDDEIKLKENLELSKVGDFLENKRRMTELDYEYRHKKFRSNSNSKKVDVILKHQQSGDKNENPILETKGIDEIAESEEHEGISNIREIDRRKDLISQIPEIYLQNQYQIQKSNAPLTKDLQEYYNYRIQNHDSIPGTSKQFLTNLSPIFYRTILPYETYTRYLDILMMLKIKGLSLMKLESDKINFLRTAVNKLALLQLDTELPLNIPKKLWYTQTVMGQYNYAVLQNLKGNTFYFNDITVLNNEEPMLRKIGKNKKFPSEIQIHYELEINSPYGFIDLTNFHHLLKNDYITFNNVYFKVIDVNFNSHASICYIKLENNFIEKKIWRKLREDDIENLLKNDEINSQRLKIIKNAANYMSDNALLFKFKESMDFLSNYILDIKSINSIITPSYSKLAQDIIYLNFPSAFDKWKINHHPYIKDIIINNQLDEIIDLSEAKRRIHEIYNDIHLQNIDEVFENYQKIPNVEHYLRFEDYYVIYSLIKNKLLTNVDGIRRFEAAINRVALRQSDNEWIRKPIVLYRGDMISSELCNNLIHSLENNCVVEFDMFLKLSSNRDNEVVKVLNQDQSSLLIPSLMEITFANQAGIIDIGRFINADNSFFTFTSNFEFAIKDVAFKLLNGHDVFCIKLQHFGNSKEETMVQIANRLFELFSTDTKFYADKISELN